jgi:hypothetical protein
MKSKNISRGERCRRAKPACDVTESHCKSGSARLILSLPQTGIICIGLKLTLNTWPSKQSTFNPPRIKEGRCMLTDVFMCLKTYVEHSGNVQHSIFVQYLAFFLISSNSQLLPIVWAWVFPSEHRTDHRRVFFYQMHMFFWCAAGMVFVFLQKFLLLKSALCVRGENTHTGLA